MDLSLLEEIGLTKSEIHVYLSLLELGNTTTGKIVDHSKVASSKVYEILEKLVQKGLCSVVVEGAIKHFEAAPPQRILDYIHEKRTTLAEQEEKVKKLLPELELKQTLNKYKTDAVLFRGLKGMETAFNDIFKTLKKGDAVCVYVVGHLDERVHAFFSGHYALRAKKGIITKTIYSEVGRKYYEQRMNIPCSEGKVLPSVTTSPATINVYGDKVLLRMGYPENLITILINNKDLATAFQQQFDDLWNQKTQTIKGFSMVTSALMDMLNELDAGESYIVLGANYGSGEKALRDWFLQFHKLRIQKGVSVKMLATADAISPIKDTFTRSGDPHLKLTELRQLQPEISTPMQINLYKNHKVLLTIWAEELTCITIDSEIIYNNFKQYFDLLWKQSR